jgi:hypothetical protein
MNEAEYRLWQTPFWITPILLPAFAVIQYLVDPFEEIRKRRLYRWPPQS